MTIELCLVAVILLLLFALFDLVVGVANDAVNFLGSPIGSKVASKQTILIIASFGIFAGALFSGGMMEVARKGIFHPELFNMPELISLFLAVMLADIIILDFFNTHGLPTSTTVSIVFELLGAAVAVSVFKIYASDGNLSELAGYINTAKAMAILLGILLSVVVAFVAGALIQFLARLMFTFQYEQMMKVWGGIWGGISVAALAHFIIAKGIKDFAFANLSLIFWIQNHSILFLLYTFIAGTVLFQMLVLCRFNMLKPIVLLGTFALALAFAANDLVNFIGVPLAGLHAYMAAIGTASPLTSPMSALQGKIESQPFFLIIAGVVMVVTLWLSRKAQKVTSTSIDLGRQEGDGFERFESAALARIIVRMVSAFFNSTRVLFPRRFRKFIKRRLMVNPDGTEQKEGAAPFDLVRASVNLIVASILVSIATSFKLPLSTTYVTFMVAMGSSFSDQAWGRDSAVYRVTGVLTVIGSWFLTAIIGFTVAFLFGYTLVYFGAGGALAIFAVAGYLMWRNKVEHERHQLEQEQDRVFNLRKIKEGPEAIALSFGHTAVFLNEINGNLDKSLAALFQNNLDELRKHRRETKRITRWANIITANVYKVFRLLSLEEATKHTDFSLTNKSLQNIAECYRDIIVRSYEHVSNHHSPLLSVQITELGQARQSLGELLNYIIKVISGESSLDLELADSYYKTITDYGIELNEKQIERVRNRSSKTRLSILYYSILSDIERVARHSIRLLDIYQQMNDGKDGLKK